MKDIVETLTLIVTRWSDEDQKYARVLLKALAEWFEKYERENAEETDRMEDEYSNYRNNEICEQRLREDK